MVLYTNIKVTPAWYLETMRVKALRWNHTNEWTN